MERDRRHFYSDRDLGATDAVEEIALFGHRFVTGDAFAVNATPNTDDWNGNLQWIRDARRQADWVIVSFHSHEFGGRSVLSAETRADLEEPAEFAREFARAAIDAGADMFVGHGSHTLLGIELYKERPIFYSLGNLVFMNETVPFLPQEAYERFGLGLDATPADFFGAQDRQRQERSSGQPEVLARRGCRLPVQGTQADRSPAASRRSRPRALARPARPPDAGERRRHEADFRPAVSGFQSAYGTEIVQQGETAIVSL